MEETHYRRRQFASWFLIYLNAIHPLHPAIAAQTPVVNINPPNASGVSHNRYDNFNVGSAGLVLNNATQLGTSSLAGELAANPHFKGHSATVIINDVTGKDFSTLVGPLAVFGQKAGVIIANPNGVHCNGCSFSNMGAITLTTAVPQLNPHGELAQWEVRGGKITIGEKGFDSLS